MANVHERPYVQFNFLVDIGTGTADALGAGFEECSGIGMETTAAEYRDGDAKGSHVQKIKGLNKATDVTLKRGIIGSSGLYQWLQDTRNASPGALRDVVVRLQNEDRTKTVKSWRLIRARITKHTAGPMNAKGTDVAMEELVLTYERLEME